MSGSLSVFYGAVVNPLALNEYQALPRCLLCVGATGNVEWITEDVPEHMLLSALAHKGLFDQEIVVLKQGEFIMPGFVDTHTHASQVPNTGSGQQYELLEWLDKVAFPMEAKFADPDFARRIYSSVVRRIIDCGTTTCCYYGTIHLEGTKILADIVHTFGQRAFVGKCNMDRHSPAGYIESSTSASISTTEALISYIRALPYAPTVHAAEGTRPEPLVQPVLTPRFAISCTPDLLSSLGTLAAANPSLRIQTHIAESHAEVALTRGLFPKARHYAGVYEQHGLLRGNTVLAHAVHLDTEECLLIKERGAGVSHCPTSNFALCSGIAPIGRYLDMGLKVGLGTDMPGGASPSILNAVQNAAVASKVLAMPCTLARLPGQGIEPTPPRAGQRYANRQLPFSALLYLATLGGAEVCDLKTRVGSFAEGKSFDALVVSVRSEAGNPGVWGMDLDVGENRRRGEETVRAMLEKFLSTGDDRNVGRVYVQGRFVGGREFRGKVD